MPFELRIAHVDYDKPTPCVSGRLVAGRYFGPEDVELALEDGSLFRTSVGTTGMSTPREWPVLPEHDTVLRLELLAQPPARIAVGTVLRGIGLSSSPPNGRRQSNDWLNAPVFWALHYYLLAGDGEKDESEICGTLFGISASEINEFYLQRFTSQRSPQPWPFFSILVASGRAIEVEYADVAEYQMRYKIVDSTGAMILGYDSGHFSRPSFRWSEVLAMASACQESLHRYQLILLLFPGIYVGIAEEAEVARTLEDCFGELDLFNAGERSTLAMNAVQNRRSESPWAYDDRMGWLSKSEYAQRNPRSLLSQLAEGDFFASKISLTISKTAQPTRRS